MMPDYAMGFWQGKTPLSYAGRAAGVAREYSAAICLSRSLSTSFTGRIRGDWMFDARDWPRPDAMIAELKSLE